MFRSAVDASLPSPIGARSRTESGTITTLDELLALEKDVEAHIKRLSAGKYKIREFEKGFGADVVVHLAHDKGEDTNIVIRYNGDSHITGFAKAKIQR